MKMSTIVLVSGILAVLPLLMAVFFLTVTRYRKILSVQQDLQKLKAGMATQPSAATAEGVRLRGRIASEEDIRTLADQYFNTVTLMAPTVLLTIFYLTGYALADSYIGVKFSDAKSPLFPVGFVLASRLMLYTFAGVYLFNLGTIIRRLYLGDLNEQVFWGAINRLWLSLGLGLVILKTPLPGGESISASVFFAIGFIANIVLEWLLSNVLKALSVGKPKSPDLPLQMVRGINIWKEYRLEEEGIENVQNLATADVAELTVRTHYNIRTLIDWIDQAILLSRLSQTHIDALAAQAQAVSAIELAAASPAANDGKLDVANALAAKLVVDPVLMANLMDNLYYDEYVKDLWYLWQSGKDDGAFQS